MIILASSLLCSLIYILTFDVISDAYNFIPKSLSILLLVFFLPKRIKGFYFLVWAILMSGLGDIFLTLKNEQYFLYGMGAFLIAHIFYAMSFLKLIKKPLNITVLQKITIANLIIISIFTAIFLNNYLPSHLKCPIYAYIFILTLMVSFSAMLKPFPSLVFIGALSFALSDSLLGISKFITPYPLDTYLIWIFYYSAQVLIILSCRHMHLSSRGLTAGSRN